MIGVTNKDGIVTLSGYVETYAARLAAERSARKVYGVKAVANELVVKLAEERIDPDIANDALHALANRLDVPEGITVTVRDGHLSLGGRVNWNYQRVSAERAVKYLRGVRGVFNNIVVAPGASPKDVEAHVMADGPRVVLSGGVRRGSNRGQTPV